MLYLDSLACKPPSFKWSFLQPVTNPHLFESLQLEILESTVLRVVYGHNACTLGPTTEPNEEEQIKCGHIVMWPRTGALHVCFQILSL